MGLNSITKTKVIAVCFVHHQMNVDDVLIENVVKVTYIWDNTTA